MIKIDASKGDIITLKSGKTKSCTPGKTFACGNACFALGRNCKKSLTKEVKENANLVKEFLDPKKAEKQSTKLNKNKLANQIDVSVTTSEERSKFEKDSLSNKGLLSSGQYRKYEKDEYVKSNSKNPPFKEELISLKNYTSNAYSLLNQYLRDSEGEYDKDYMKENKSDIELSIKMAKAALEYMPKYEGKVKRASVVNDQVLNYYRENVGKEIVEKGFTSTTNEVPTRDLLETFGGSEDNPGSNTVLYSINSKNGRQLESISDYPNEGEVLFAPNTKFKVSKVDSTTKYKDAKGKEHTIHLVILEES